MEARLGDDDTIDIIPTTNFERDYLRDKFEGEICFIKIKRGYPGDKKYFNGLTICLKDDNE